jgi:trehalose 6-phosphate phosphatase
MIGSSTVSELAFASLTLRNVRPKPRRPAALKIAHNVDDLPTITPTSALFLDFDGTLADLMPTPDDVRITPTTWASIVSLRQHLAGALAIITGRSIVDLDRMLAPLKLSVAGMHGVEMRLGDDAIIRRVGMPQNIEAILLDAAQSLRPLVALNSGLRLEDKTLALSLHYRAAPEHAALCWHAATAAIHDAPSLEVRPGKMVVEIVPRAADKGAAIRDFMSRPPFAGRTPLFAGDDAADEDAIAMVQSMGGIGIRIVDDHHTPTCATFSVGSAQIVRDWLAQPRISPASD